MNMITCASGIPRYIGGIYFQLVLGGVVMFWRYPDSSVDGPYPALTIPICQVWGRFTLLVY